MLVGKYADRLPLYRQSQIFARSGLSIDRSTLADWVGTAFSGAFAVPPARRSPANSISVPSSTGWPSI
ncbi:transposase [Poseidonocella sp. HB161398]|uniref:IS66 family transposase n=1 Tax=Poseidonocella sp. HB161398 TaxID=2320855 RepID=UPI00351918F7